MLISQFRIPFVSLTAIESYVGLLFLCVRVEKSSGYSVEYAWAKLEMMFLEQCTRDRAETKSKEINSNYGKERVVQVLGFWNEVRRL